MAVECPARWNGGVIIPCQEFAGNHLVYTNIVHPEVDGLIEFTFNCFLTNDGNDNTITSLELFAHLQSRADIIDVITPPLLWIARFATTRWAYFCIGICVTRIHRKLDEIDSGAKQAFQFASQPHRRAKHTGIRIEPYARALCFGVLNHLRHLGMKHRLTAARATHPCAVLPTFICHPVPQLYREKLAAIFTIEATYL